MLSTPVSFTVSSRSRAQFTMESTEQRSNYHLVQAMGTGRRGQTTTTWLTGWSTNDFLQLAVCCFTPGKMNGEGGKAENHSCWKGKSCEPNHSLFGSMWIFGGVSNSWCVLFLQGVLHSCKLPFFWYFLYRRSIFKWLVFHCHLSFQRVLALLFLKDCHLGGSPSVWDNWSQNARPQVQFAVVQSGLREIPGNTYPPEN